MSMNGFLELIPMPVRYLFPPVYIKCIYICTCIYKNLIRVLRDVWRVERTHLFDSL